MPESAPLATERPPHTTPPARDDRSLQEQLGLSGTEIEILMRLVTGGPTGAELGSVNGIIGSLRRKLAGHGVGLLTVRDFGWKLDQKDRERIVALIGSREPTIAPRGSGRDGTEPRWCKIPPTR